MDPLQNLFSLENEDNKNGERRIFALIYFLTN